MSDVLFRYLLTARARDESLPRRLFLADESLLAAGVEQLVESAAARVEVTSQHERISRRKDTVPESKHRSVRFYTVAQPNRPKEGHFERRKEEFPLRETLSLFTCPTCRGRGEVSCGRCSGRGSLSCSSCRGSGRDAKRGRGRCRRCSGSGRRACDRCSGRGKVRCGKCRGEGRLASWDVEVYTWLVEERSGDEVPLETEKTRVLGAFKRWLKVEADRVANLESETAIRHLGFATTEALGVVSRADARRITLEKEARSTEDRYLFHRTLCSLAPVGYTVVRLQGRASTYWLVGRGEKAVEVIPRGRPDRLKCVGWLGLGSGSFMGYESLAQAADLVPLFAAGIEPVWLAGGTAASWLATGFGIRRIRQRKPPVATLGLLTASGRPTAFLTCLAYLGSYLQHLRVLDSAYDVQSERLLGRMRPDRQSESLTLELSDGRKIRVVEVANPRQLSESQIKLMVKALDGVMILDDKEQPADDLKRRLAAVATPSLNVASLVVDNATVTSLDPAASSLSLEAVRQAFVENVTVDVDWSAIYQTMWRPLGDLLETGGREAS